MSTSAGIFFYVIKYLLTYLLKLGKRDPELSCAVTGYLCFSYNTGSVIFISTLVTVGLTVLKSSMNLTCHNKPREKVRG